MITYLLQVSLCWAFFYLIYHLFFRKETFFSFNRGYLMSTLLLSLFVPQIGLFLKSYFTTQPAEMGSIVYYMAESPGIIAEMIVHPAEQSNFWMNLITLFYCLGLVIASSRLLYGLHRIFSLYTSGEKIVKNGYTLIKTEKAHLPFSFFHYVFISNKLDLKKDIREILTHEACHVESMHSLDILALELIHTVFWFNPILLLYKKALRQSHEYTADACVLQTSNTKNYGQILLGQSSSGLEVALANHFFNSQLKNRINMMYQKKSTKWARLKYLAALPVLLLVVFLFSNGVLPDENKSMESILTDDETLYDKNISSLENTYSEWAIDDKMTTTNGGVSPRFPGCEEIEEMDSRNKCAQEKLLRYIYTNIKYPAEARKAGQEGMVVVSFTVSKDGTIKSPIIKKSVAPSLDQEVIRVINAMNELKERWIPATENNEAVDAEYLIPVRYKLEGETKTKEENTHKKTEETGGILSKRKKNVVTKIDPTVTVVGHEVPVKTQAAREVFTTTEQMPRFPGCESLSSDAEKENCAKKNLLEYIYNNLSYPAEARDAGIEGMTVIQFVVKADGSLDHIKAVRDIGKGCGDAAKAVVASMKDMEEKWTPGYQRGKAVDVLYTLPVRFKLEDKDKDKDEEEEVEEKRTLSAQKKVNGSTDPIYYLDGKKISGVQDLNPDDIASISVYKNEKAVAKFGEEGRDGVVEIFTKGYKKNETDTIYEEEEVPLSTFNLRTQLNDGKPLIVIDGVIQDAELDRAEELDADEIVSVEVFKGKSAIEKYGERAKDGAISIITKAYQEFPEILEERSPDLEQLREIKLPVEKWHNSSTQFLDEFNAFPNPSQGYLNLEIKGKEGPIKIGIFSLDGRALYYEVVNNFDGFLSTRIENNTLKNTTAIVTIQQGKKMETKKVIFSE